jgi:DNA-binding transcriptional LysR family regulator
MELRHLRYFVAVAEELHFRRAAERLHVAQPAVSEQIRKLEQELGVVLLERTPRRVSLTIAGAAFLTEARHVLRHAEVAQRAARTARDVATMRLRIGYLPHSLPSSVPTALRRLAAAAPNVQVLLETGPALRLVHEVRDGRLDAVVTSLPGPTSGLRTMLLDHQRVVAALPATHGHARESSITLERLAPDRLVLLPRDANPAFYNAVVSLCHGSGLSPALIELDAPRVEDALLAVAAGTGMALLPESVIERYSVPGIRFVPLETAQPAFQSAVLSHPDTKNLATAAFLRSLAEAQRGVEMESSRAALRLAA